MISEPGNRSFNYIFCSPSLFLPSFSCTPPSSLPLSLQFCLFLASVYGQTFVTLPSSLWLPLCLSLCEAMETGFFSSAFLSTSFFVRSSHLPCCCSPNSNKRASLCAACDCMRLRAKLHQNDKRSYKWHNGDECVLFACICFLV